MEETNLQLTECINTSGEYCQVSVQINGNKRPQLHFLPCARRKDYGDTTCQRIYHGPCAETVPVYHSVGQHPLQIYKINRKNTFNIFQNRQKLYRRHVKVYLTTNVMTYSLGRVEFHSGIVTPRPASLPRPAQHRLKR